MAAFASVDVNDTLAATTYSRACYGNLQNLLQCTQNPQQQLPWNVNRNATCPFTNDLCIYGDLSAYEMDTGHIDSHQALGINAPKSERVQYRKVTTCKLSAFHAYSLLCIVLQATFREQIEPCNLSHDHLFYLEGELLIQRTTRLPHPHQGLRNVFQ